MQNKTVGYYRKQVYGNEHMYIADPKIASAVAQLTGNKILLPNKMEALKNLGFTFEEVLAPKNHE
ncbi:MAG: hypothetical protein [Siphoviridae sp. cttb18]|nr:MAG: hypothetical protein [Siphoviridae sp. cttb18]